MPDMPTLDTEPAAYADHVAGLADLVRHDRAHRRIYTDPAIFALEMRRIFGRAWLYVAHESEVRAEGDFVASRMANLPVLVTRDSEGMINVLVNRCGHRGAAVCQQERGNSRAFRCPYHGWSYRNDGSLLGVPNRQTYPDGYDFSMPELRMKRVPRVATYRGFVFASLAPEGPDLPTYLGAAMTGIDDLMDRAPFGEIERAGGALKYAVNANWKLPTENYNDFGHNTATHESSYSVAKTFTPNDRVDPFEIRPVDIIRQNGARADVFLQAGVYAFDWGHSYNGSHQTAAGGKTGGLIDVENAPEGSAYAEYWRLLVARHGLERAQQVVRKRRHLSVVWPTMGVQAFYMRVSTMHPISVDRTEVHIVTFRMKGAPEMLFKNSVRYLTTVNSPGSIILPDDIEVFEQAQRNLSAPAAGDWVVFPNGVGAEQPHREADRFDGLRGNGLSELTQRNQLKAWRHFMLDAAY
jgi:phenylpropionate dioxygenase-like ring-hydroxylating dioxygenase large terminal subunit